MYLGKYLINYQTRPSEQHARAGDGAHAEHAVLSGAAGRLGVCAAHKRDLHGRLHTRLPGAALRLDATCRRGNRLPRLQPLLQCHRLQVAALFPSKPSQQVLDQTESGPLFQVMHGSPGTQQGYLGTRLPIWPGLPWILSENCSSLSLWSSP